MIQASYHVCKQLLKKDMLAFKREYPTKLFDTFCLFFTIVIVFCYFMPQEGVHEGYASFFLIGAIASFGFVEIVGKVGALMADLQGDCAISHTLIMPIRSEMVFIYIGLQWAITSALLSIFLFPLGKLLLFKGFDLSLISYPRLIFMFVTINLFFGYFALWLTSVIKDVSGLTSLWLRYINPIWMFGAYFYSWEAAYALSPVIGAVSLINPMVYVMEGMRAAALGQAGYLPYWLCQVMLWGFIIACTWHAIRRMKKRLDCV
ncbi:hypothetical protein [Simkania sp.]|uniref:hypothetical protein n=1 Tax=Simkania sp. TaxID=34094 RepID=UPI003B52ECD9